MGKVVILHQKTDKDRKNMNGMKVDYAAVSMTESVLLDIAKFIEPTFKLEKSSTNIITHGNGIDVHYRVSGFNSFGIKVILTLGECDTPNGLQIKVRKIHSSADNSSHWVEDSMFPYFGFNWTYLSKGK